MGNYLSLALLKHSIILSANFQTFLHI